MSNDQYTVDFTSLFIWDRQGVERIELNREYTPEQMVEALVDAWIPYFECHECGRWDYCKYPKQHPNNFKHSIDIQCGVARDAIQSLFERTFHLLRDISLAKRQDWLDGAFHFVQFVYSTELQIGNFLDRKCLDWWATYAPATFGQLVGLRKHLDGIAKHFRSFPQFRGEESVLFVEGRSEKAFLERLKASRLASLVYLQVEVYDGSGNKRPKRIQMLLDKYRDRGYQIFVQGDADGNNKDVLQALRRQCALLEEHTFVFRHNFETSIPPELLLPALQILGALEDVDIGQFREVLGDRDASVGAIVREVYGLDLCPIKIDLAELVADILNDSWSNWWSNDEFMQTELGRFLGFVGKL